MSETVLRVLLEELATVRVVCQGRAGAPCGAAVEVLLAQVPSVVACPACGNDLREPRASVSLFAALAKGVADALAVSDRARVEFVVKAPAGAGGG